MVEQRKSPAQQKGTPTINKGEEKKPNKRDQPQPREL